MAICKVWGRVLLVHFMGGGALEDQTLNIGAPPPVHHVKPLLSFSVCLDNFVTVDRLLNMEPLSPVHRGVASDSPIITVMIDSQRGCAMWCCTVHASRGGY